jgi:multiple sugar transport system permease protein
MSDTQMSRSERPAGFHEPRARLVSNTLFMVLFAAYFITPMWWLFVASTKSQADISTTAGLWFSQPFQLLDNVGAVLTYDDHVFVRWFGNSVLYAGLGALLGTFISAMAGYALAKYTFRFRETYFNIVLAGVLVPATALALPLFLLFAKVGAVNTFWAVFIPSLVNPFGVYLARVYAAAGVPDELIESGRLDGAGEFRIFATIALRLMAPALVTIYLFQFVAIWNNFFLPLIMLQDDRLYPVTLGLYSWNSQILQMPTLRLLVIVGSFLSVIPLIIAFLSLQRFWRAGLASGAVKA